MDQIPRNINGFEIVIKFFDVHKELNAIVGNVAKLRHFEKYESIKSELEKASKSLEEIKKNAVKSETFRKEGNNCYRNTNFYKALELFNQSLCFAPDGSEQHSMAYGNRSAVYFSLELYELCLKNIKVAREIGYPANLVSKLDEREAKCLFNLRNSKDKPKHQFNGLEPKLSYPTHEKVPFIANCLALKINEHNDRYIVAKTDLKVGDIVAIERPFCGGVTPVSRYMCCTNCLREVAFDLFPCPVCHSAMFCSPQCYAEAKEAFHDIECPMMSVLMDSDILGNKERTLIRLLILVVKRFKTIDALIQFTKHVKKTEQNIFTADYANSEIIDMFASILKLGDHNEKYEIPKTVQADVTSASLIYKCLLNFSSFKDLFRTKEEVEFLMDLSLALCRSATFKLTITKVKRFELLPNDDLEYAKQKACVGIYPFRTLLNRSCVGNVIQRKRGNLNITIVVKPIEKGQALNDAYGLTHRNANLKIRQKGIKEEFNRICKCVACVKDYPEIKDICSVKKYDFIDPIYHLGLCMAFEMDTIKELIPKYCAFLNTYSKQHYPGKMTDVAEEILSTLYEVVYENEYSLAKKPKFPPGVVKILEFFK